MSQIISFPRLGNYDVVLKPLLECLLPRCQVLLPPPITAEQLALGCRHSPDDICVPFKYNLGGFIHSLENGANVLLQTGTGCRFAYYAAVQERILRDMGYRFTMIKLQGNTMGLHTADTLRSLGCPLTIREILGCFWLAAKSMALLDSFEAILREQKGLTEDAPAMERLHKVFLRDMGSVRNFRTLGVVRRHYLPALRRLSPAVPGAGVLRVGIIGELFTVMEPAANLYLEDKLARLGVSVSRPMNAGYLLIGQHLKPPLRRTGGYLRFDAGGTAPNTVAHCVELAKRGFNGVLHLKSFGCVPELNVMPVLRQISQDTHMPIAHLSFDALTAEAGLDTRLEAFVDMLGMTMNS